MADKSFGVKELNLLNASGTPTVTSPNNLNLNANTVAISTSCTIGNNLTVTSTTNSANLNVTGIGTITRAFATDLSVSGVTTITVPANANPHSSWDVVNNSASAYRFTGPGQDGAEDNPNIYLVRGQRYVFKMNASGHPFQIRVANAGAAYSDGVTNNGSQTGNVVFNVQHDAPAQLFYQCTSHGSMVGNIYIVGGPQVISGVVTATTFSGSGASLTNLPAANLTGTLPVISGANLTSLPAQATIANNGNDRIITGGSGVNLNGEANLQFDGTDLYVSDNIKHLGDPDTLIQFATDTITFDTAGAERLRIKQSGEVQIGAVDQGVNRGASSIKAATDGGGAPINVYLQEVSGSEGYGLGVDSDGDLNFYNSGATSPTLEIRDSNNVAITDGNLIVANGHGIDFSATGDAGNSASMSNELLDDYEEGSWTPTGSWTTIVARYTKIGRMVYAGFSLRANTSSGNVTIGGFPFTSDSNHAASGGIAWGLCEFNSSSGWLNGSIGDGETTATIRKNNASVLTFGSGSNNLNQNAFIRGTFIYHTA